MIHLDGMREIHDCLRLSRPLGDRDRRDQGGPCGRVPRHDEHDDFQGDRGRRRYRDDGLSHERGRHRRHARRSRLPVPQIDPNLTMTRAEHEEKFRAIRAAVRKSGFRWLASPVYQDFLTGERELPCTPWGSVTRNPYGWKGLCYLLTDAIFPPTKGSSTAWSGSVWPGERSAVRALRDPLRVRALGDAGGDCKPRRPAEPHGRSADGYRADHARLRSQSKSGRPEEAAPRQSSGSAWAHRGPPLPGGS